MASDQDAFSSCEAVPSSVEIAIGSKRGSNPLHAIGAVNASSSTSYGLPSRWALPVTDDLETVALRPMVVDGQVQPDDYEVIWRGLMIGRLMKQADSPHWWWCCNLYGQPPTANDRGPAINFKDSQLRFKLAWTRIRAALTAEEIAVATRHAEAQRSSAPEEPEVQQAYLAREKQRAPRQRVLKAATMEFDGATMDCVVRNISETGAALEVGASLDVPPEFNLLISGHGTSHRCEVKWRKENRIGVAFK